MKLIILRLVSYIIARKIKTVNSEKKNQGLIFFSSPETMPKQFSGSSNRCLSFNPNRVMKSTRTSYYPKQRKNEKIVIIKTMQFIQTAKPYELYCPPYIETKNLI